MDEGPGSHYTIIKEQAQRQAKRYNSNKIYNYISDFVDGTITKEQFWVLAKFKYPTHQINFCTNEALKCLKYRGNEEVDS